MSSKTILFSFFPALAAVLAVFLGAVNAATITVGPGGFDHLSIQEAIDAASPGDYVVVARGTYHENLVVDKPLVLQAFGEGTDMPIIDAAGRGSAVTLIADGVVLEGFILQNGGFGRAGIEVRSDENQIRGNLITDNRWYGIFLEDAAGCVIEENVIWKNKYGIWINSGSQENRIARNVLQDNADRNAFDLGTNLWEGNFYSDYDGSLPLYEIDGISSVDRSPSGPEREPVAEEPVAEEEDATGADQPPVRDEMEVEDDLGEGRAEPGDGIDFGLNGSLESTTEDAAGGADHNLNDLDAGNGSADGKNDTLEPSAFMMTKERPRISIVQLSSLLDETSEEEGTAENASTPTVGDAAGEGGADGAAAIGSGASESAGSAIDESPVALAQESAVEDYTAQDWTRSGDSFSRSGRYSDAIGCYDQAIEMDPQLAEAWDGKGGALMMTGRYDRALVCYQRGLEIAPDSAEIWYHKGNALQMLLRFEEALVSYDQALRINTQFAEAWNRKGMTLNRLGRYQEAIACFDEAIEIEPGYAAAWSNKSWSLQMLGDDQAAKEAFDQARALGYG